MGEEVAYMTWLIVVKFIAFWLLVVYTNGHLIMIIIMIMDYDYNYVNGLWLW